MLRISQVQINFDERGTRISKSVCFSHEILIALAHISAYKKKEQKRWIMKAFMGYLVWESCVGTNI